MNITDNLKKKKDKKIWNFSIKCKRIKRHLQ